MKADCCMKTLKRIFVCLWIVLTPIDIQGAKAEEADTAFTAASENEEMKPPASVEGSEAAPDSDAKLQAMEKRLLELEKKSAADDARAALDAEKIEDLSERLDRQEEEDIKRLSEKDLDLRIFGFVDFQFFKYFIPDDAFLNGLTPSKTGFGVGHWNLILEKPLSEHFSLLGEVRFLFQPMGQETEWFGGAGENEPYGYFDNEGSDWLDNYFFGWGAVHIQRLYLQFKLNDYFAVRAGNYLTPFGIWNEDHGSPVILFARRPMINTGDFLPESQTGLYFFGKAYLSEQVSFQYGLTVSNGRGPAAELYDLDENKGLGLGLQLTYDGFAYVNAGTYLYMGDYTEVEKRLQANPFDFVETIAVSYKEKVMSFHLKFLWKGLLIQGEYIRRLIEYVDGKREIADWGAGRLYSPDHIRQGSYEVLAYTLPFKKVTLTPYALHEYRMMPDWVQYYSGHRYGGGINWRIIPPVVLKVEASYMDNDPLMGVEVNHFTTFVTQLAVVY